MNLTRDTEHALLALMLDTDCRTRARALVQPKWMHETSHTKMLEAAFAWDVDHETELTVHGWAKLYAQREEIPMELAGQQIVEALFMSGAPKNLEAYGELIREDWERRTIGKIGAGLYHGSKDDAKSPLDLAAQASTVSEVIRERHSESQTGEQALAEAAMRSTAGTVHTGFVDLDRLLGGMAPGNVTTIAARTSMGKTAFAVDIMRNLSADGIPVGYVTLEMDGGEIYSRMIRIPSLVTAQPRFWYPSRRATPDAIAAQGLNWAADGLGLIVIDHLGLVACEAKSRSLYERTTENMHDMKRLARTLKVPMLLLAQLNREGADGRFPVLADLRDSGAIEEDSDAVILLHRPYYFDRSKPSDEAWAALLKNRHGRTGLVRIHWDDERGTFGNAAHEFPR